MKSKDLQKLINTLFPNESISEIKNLSLNQLSITGKKNDIDLNELEKFISLETLSLRNFEINNDNAKQICKVKNLILNNCAINISDNINSNIEYLSKELSLDEFLVLVYFDNEYRIFKYDSL